MMLFLNGPQSLVVSRKALCVPLCSLLFTSMIFPNVCQLIMCGCMRMISLCSLHIQMPTPTHCTHSLCNQSRTGYTHTTWRYQTPNVLHSTSERTTLTTRTCSTIKQFHNKLQPNY